MLPFAIGFIPNAEDEKVILPTEIRTTLSDLKLDTEEGKDDEDKTIFIIKMEEEDFALLYQYGGGDKDQGSSLQMVYFLTPEDAKKAAEKVNEWNRDERFTKAYIGEDGDAYLEQDFDVAAGYEKAAVRKFIKDYMAAIPEFIKHME